MRVSMKPINMFVPITRVDEEKREVEGIAFANEVVEGEGGIRLLRTAMEEATADYMQWGAVRSMHQPLAAGTAQSVDWQDGRAHILCRIVDDNEWRKVKEKVYKGFSIGVQALVMRGKDVQKCRWIETSLVDRPKDPEAMITTFRAEGLAEEYDVEVLDEELETTDAEDPSETAESDPAISEESEDPERSEDAELTRAAPKFASVTHYDCGARYGCHGHTTEGGAQECADARERDIQEQIDELRKMRVDGADEALITRFAQIQTSLLERIQTAEVEVVRVQAELDAARGRIRELERMPLPGKAVLYPRALNREFMANTGQASEEAVRDTIKTEYNRLANLGADASADERGEAVVRMQILKMQAAALGISLTER